YQRSSIFVLPSLKEALPMSILESLACGTPVVATTVGGIPEIIRNNENGILVPQNDEKKLAEAIDYLLQNKDVRVRLGQNGRKNIVERFSYRSSIKKLLKIYQKMLRY
ncbi:MAG: glycosyltransferase family 4 protein, partial [Nitrososphaeria archaeon]